LLNLINNIACNLLPQFYCLDIAYSFLQCTHTNPYKKKQQEHTSRSQQT